MNKKLKKKLAYYIASGAFNGEERSTATVLRDIAGVNVTDEEAEEITDMICRLFDRFRDLSEGWQEAIQATERPKSGLNDENGNRHGNASTDAGERRYQCDVGGCMDA